MKGLLGRVSLEVGGWWRWARRIGGACILSVTTAGCAFEGLAICGGIGATDPDCETPIQEPDPRTVVCPLYPIEHSPVGICVPFVDVGWHYGLFRMAYLPMSELTCPASAPNAGLLGEEVPTDGSIPRNVIGCSIHPYSSCPPDSGPDSGMVCVPSETDYPACVTRDGPESCPDDYPDPTTVEKDGPGGEATVCCRRDDDDQEGPL
jgi:hypothetical protein